MADATENDIIHPTGPGAARTHAPNARPDSALASAARQTRRPPDEAVIQRTAIRRQREAIARYRQSLTRALGRDVSLDEAARIWIPAFAAQWREEFEAALEAVRRPVSF